MARPPAAPEAWPPAAPVARPPAAPAAAVSSWLLCVFVSGHPLAWSHVQCPAQPRSTAELGLSDHPCQESLEVGLAVP